MKHLDLFSGIGAWAIASGEVWTQRQMVGFVEIAHFPSQVLAKNYPDVPRYGDIKTFDASPFRGIDILTGSPPCQSASVAGKRKGTSDDRWLWDEYVRVVRECAPRWIVAENVPGILNLEGGVPFDSLLTGLEAEGYETLTLVLPAASVGAPHRRDRVWIVARQISGYEPRPYPSDHGHELAGDSRERRAGFADSSGDATDAKGEQNRRIQQPGVQPNSFDRRDWNRDWREVATATCVRRMDDGVPSHVYGPDRISEAAHRRERLKALGNAIVPAVAVEIMRAIRYIDDEICHL